MGATRKTICLVAAGLAALPWVPFLIIGIPVGIGLLGILCLVCLFIAIIQAPRLASDQVRAYIGVLFTGGVLVGVPLAVGWSGMPVLLRVSGVALLTVTMMIIIELRRVQAQRHARRLTDQQHFGVDQ